MEDLLPFIPPDWARVLDAICQIIGALSVIALGIKSLMGEPKPTDNAVRAWAFRVIGWIDWAAVNTEPVRSKLRRLDDENMRRVERNSGRKPPPLPLLVLAFSLALPMPACAWFSSPLKAHATAADAAASVIDQAGAIIEHSAKAAEQSALAVASTPDEARALIAEARDRFASIEAAYESLRVAHEHYVEEIRVAERDGRDDIAPDALRAIGLAWAHLQQLADRLAIKLPRPPDDLAELLGGES